MAKCAEIIEGIWQGVQPIELKRSWLEPRGWWPFDSLDCLGEGIYGGGYGEVRDVYLSPQFQGTKPRTVHMGYDIFAPVGSSVFCPHDGEIVTLHDNNLPLDYGPTLIMHHEGHFTLYGHLSRTVFTNLKLGQLLKAGDLIGPLGQRIENGGWPAHIHVQIIKDLPLGALDYPGVCAVEDFDAYRIQCPDPAPFLGLTDSSR
jgi:murein DD-endopeptidase MepM/ murein hydrolase activator NlpD